MHFTHHHMCSVLHMCLVLLSFKIFPTWMQRTDSAHWQGTPALHRVGSPDNDNTMTMVWHPNHCKSTCQTPELAIENPTAKDMQYCKLSFRAEWFSTILEEWTPSHWGKPLCQELFTGLWAPLTYPTESPYSSISASPGAAEYLHPNLQLLIAWKCHASGCIKIGSSWLPNS